MVFPVDLEVLLDLPDALRQERHLHLGRARIVRLARVLGDDRPLLLARERHARSASLLLASAARRSRRAAVTLVSLVPTTLSMVPCCVPRVQPVQPRAPSRAPNGGKVRRYAHTPGRRNRSWPQVASGTAPISSWTCCSCTRSPTWP